MPSGIYKRNPHTEITKTKMRISHLGKIFSDDHKKNLSKNHADFKGEKSPCYKGGYANHIYHNNQRRIRKLNAIGSHTFGEWEILKIQYNFTCPCCLKKEPEITLSEDHIIPLTKGGSDYIENIQPLCRACNSRKGNRIIIKYI